MERIRASMTGTAGNTVDGIVADIKALRKQNCRYIRYQIVNPQEQFEGREMSEIEQRGYFQHEFNKLSGVLPLIGADMKVIVDFHTPPGGIDLTHPQSYHRVFLNRPDLVARFFEQWQMLMTIKSPKIIAYDLFNEPSGPTAQVWAMQDKLALDIVRKVSSLPVIVSTVQGSSAYKFKVSKVKNVWYTCHVYPNHSYQNEAVTPSEMTERRLNRTMSHCNAFKKEHPDKKVFIGETGCLRWAGQGRNQANWLRTFIKYLEARGYDWCFHAWREYHGWSVELPPNSTDMEPMPDSRRLKMMARAWKNGRP